MWQLSQVNQNPPHQRILPWPHKKGAHILLTFINSFSNRFSTVVGIWECFIVIRESILDILWSYGINFIIIFFIPFRTSDSEWRLSLFRFGRPRWLDSVSDGRFGIRRPRWLDSVSDGRFRWFRFGRPIRNQTQFRFGCNIYVYITRVLYCISGLRPPSSINPIWFWFSKSFSTKMLLTLSLLIPYKRRYGCSTHKIVQI